MTWELKTADSPSIKIMQGDVKVTDDPTVIMSALVGSCIATCIYDPVAKVGGMNHFLLAESSDIDDHSMMYGFNQMELLINRIRRMGGKKRDFKAKLFGGNALGIGYGSFGKKNAELAYSFLYDEQIPIVSASVAGTWAQRIEFHPTTGKVRAKYIKDDQNIPAPEPVKVPQPSASQGDVDFF